jgi:hypothetical protein
MIGTKRRERAMHQMAMRIDDFGKPAWIALMVIGFIVFWPIGLAILGYMIWSGRMGCGRWHRGHWRGQQFREKFGKWAGPTGPQYTTGNRAFDEYRADTLRRLEEEARDFEGFLDRLRMAKDKAEFDDFMAQRRANPPQPPEAPEADKPAGA